MEDSEYALPRECGPRRMNRNLEGDYKENVVKILRFSTLPQEE